ncbi:hypothetical protein NW768_008503 [Fusarium equiseti]|uniref:F-box domain-containing protein n=1 Tax=Fusarium equiseti TaxID=61235 RepID=A0ABQ8R787_FUSEQ|nr:hypothetical protein NW768_008503 [Fusarium equiseti]
MAASSAETRVYLFHLPAELYRKIASYLRKDSLKNLRATCSALNKITPFIIDRVFISANSLNLQVFRAIADSETFRHNVTEIIWDDARLPEETEDEIERTRFQYIGDEDRTFQARRQDSTHPGFRFRGSSKCLVHNNLSVEESWDYYYALLQDQIQILATAADIEAFKHGIRRFPNLKRVTVTPSTHGNIGQPMYQTPMIRAFPPRFDYPLPREWPYAREDHVLGAYAWIPDESDDPQETEEFEWMYQVGPEDYREKWRGVRTVLRMLAEHSWGHNITEFIIGGTEIASGLNCRLFDQSCREYDDLVIMLQRPGFSRLDLDLFTGVNEYGNWKSFRSGLLFEALSEAKDLRHITLHTTTDIVNGKMVHLTPNGLPGFWPFPLQTVFPISCWPKLEHFGISNILVTQEDLLSFLAALPYCTRSIELSNLAWADETKEDDEAEEDEGGDYHSLLNEIRTRLD